jgi:SOS-response transcriptional repressor LexA
VRTDVLTKNQRRALLLIEAEVERTGGVAPSVRELAEQMGYKSQTTARNVLLGLERRGFIRRLEGRDRAIEVLRPISRFATFRFDDKSKRLRRTGK